MAVLAGLAMLIVGTRPIDPDQPSLIPGPVLTPTHVFAEGFAELHEQLGTEVMGWPVEPEHPVIDADSVQRTTTGLAVWRKGTLPAFTNGAQTFELKPEFQAASVPSRFERLADCIIARESRGNPNAVNRSSGASGLGQFLGSTWKSTPQGKAGYSVFDPVANRAAVIWMLSVGRGREFVTIGGC